MLNPHYFSSFIERMLTACFSLVLGTKLTTIAFLCNRNVSLNYIWNGLYKSVGNGRSLLIERFAVVTGQAASSFIVRLVDTNDGVLVLSARNFGNV